MRVYSYQPREKPIKRPVVKSRKIGKFKWPLSTRKTLTWLFRLFAVGILALAILFLYYAKDLPDPNRLLDRNVAESTKIFARDGQLLYEIHGEVKRTLVNLDQISGQAKHAAIALEDKDFYKHKGISVTGIARSIIVDILKGRKAQGGSTITQQFVKNAILSKDKSWDRKLREIILSLAIEARFNKDEILKLYLNEIPYGRNAYGIEAASQSYFGKNARDLTLAESAYLAALPQAPTFYNPSGPNRAALDSRKNYALKLMREQGYISETEEKEAKEEKVEFSKITTGILAPHFSLMVQDYLANKFGEKTLQEGGLKVYTTLDLSLQKIAEDAIKTGVETNSKKYNGHNASLVAIDPKTGQILALVGSKDYFADPEPAGCAPGKNCLFEPNVNVAIALRQPGSSFKPYAYVTAFKPEFKYSPATMLMDVTTNFGKYGDKDYIPQNYDGKEHGVVSMRKALAGSLNIPAVKTVALVGVENVTQTARDLGLTSPMSDCGLSLVLGGCEVKLLDHVAAFSVLANGGVKNEKTFILKIEDKNGSILEEYKDDPKKVLDPQAVYELTSIMTDNNARSFIFGANSPLILPDRIVAAKTGTTQKWHDGWTLGFTPSLAAGVWVGNNDGTFLKNNADGVVVAAPIWNKFMKEALKGKPIEEFSRPENIKEVVVDEISGKLPTGYTPSTKTEIFADYAVPTDYDNVHIGVPYDSITNTPATENTPLNQIVYKPFTVFHSEKRDNPDWENPVIAWAQAQGYQYPPNTGNFLPQGDNTNQAMEISILEPSDNSTVSNLPLKVIISAVPQNQISKITLSIDGQEIQSLNTSPFIFDLNKKFSDGRHILAAKAFGTNGKTADTSININFALNQPIVMAEPGNSSLVIFPLSLKAESATLYDEVNFYYQTSKTSPVKLIGKADNITNLSGQYQYALEWKDKPAGNVFYVFARTNTGTNTEKIKINTQ